MNFGLLPAFCLIQLSQKNYEEEKGVCRLTKMINLLLNVLILRCWGKFRLIFGRLLDLARKAGDEFGSCLN